MVLHIRIKSAVNGTISLRLLLDTNVIIDFLKQKDDSFDLSSMLFEHECGISVITKLELLKYPDILPSEEQKINEFIQLFPVLPINVAIENETIVLSRSTRLKLLDAIIGATAIVYDAKIVTRDSHFLNCQYEKMHIWKPS